MKLKLNIKVHMNNIEKRDSREEDDEKKNKKKKESVNDKKDGKKSNSKTGIFYFLPIFFTKDLNLLLMVYLRNNVKE